MVVATKKPQKANIVKKALNYIKETKAEIAQVTWLPRQKVALYVIVVVIVSIFIAAYVALVDVALMRFLEFLKEAIR